MASATIFVYDGYDVMVAVMKALAMFPSSETIKSLIVKLGLLTTGYSAIKKYIAKAGGDPGGIMKKYLAAYILIPILIAPGSTVVVKDVVTNEFEDIDRVPNMISKIVVPLEGWSYKFSKAIRDTILPGYVETETYPFFGLRAIQQFKEVRADNGAYAKTVDSYFRSCLMQSAKMRNIDLHDFMASTDPFLYLEGHVNDFFMSDTYNNSGNISETTNCKESTRLLKQMSLDRQNDIIASIWKGFGLRSDKGKVDGAEVRAKMARILSFNTHSASSTLMNDIPKLAIWSALKDSAGAYSDGRAKAQMIATNMVASNNVLEITPIIITVFKCLAYMLLIIMFPLFIFTMDVNIFKQWMNFMLALMIAMPVSEVLNAFVYISWSYKMGDVPLTMANYMHHSAQAGMFVSIAQGLQALVLPLCWALVSKGGLAQGMVHMAGSLMRGSVASTMQVGSEMAHASVSVGNKSIGNENSYNTTANQHVYSALIRGGANTMQRLDGSESSTFGNGRTVNRMGVGYTDGQGRSSIMLQDALTQSLSDQYNDSTQKLASASQQFNTSDAKVHDIRQAISEGIQDTISSGKTSTIANTLSRSVGYNKVLEAVDRSSFAKNITTSDKQILAASAYIGLPFQSVLKNIGISAEIRGSADRMHNSERTYNKLVEESSRNSFSENIEDAKRFSEDENFLKSIGMTKTNSKDIADSFQHREEASKSLAMHEQHQQQIQHSLSKVRNMGSNQNIDITQKTVDYVSKKYGMSTFEARRGIDNGKYKSEIDEVANQYGRQIDANMPEVKTNYNSIGAIGSPC